MICGDALVEYCDDKLVGSGDIPLSSWSEAVQPGGGWPGGEGEVVGGSRVLTMGLGCVLRISLLWTDRSV
jgi:hypothetical protein